MPTSILFWNWKLDNFYGFNSSTQKTTDIYFKEKKWIVTKKSLEIISKTVEGITVKSKRQRQNCGSLTINHWIQMCSFLIFLKVFSYQFSVFTCHLTFCNFVADINHSKKWLYLSHFFKNMSKPMPKLETARNFSYYCIFNILIQYTHIFTYIV